MRIQNKADADKAGRKHLELEAEIQNMEMERDADIRVIREQSKKKIDARKKENESILSSLADWFWTVDERDGKTKGQLTLTHVKLTERITTKLVYPSPLTKVINKAKKLGLDQFIRIKEEVNKQKILDEASDDQLKALEIKKSPETTVYVESR